MRRPCQVQSMPYRHACQSDTAFYRDWARRPSLISRATGVAACRKLDIAHKHSHDKPLLRRMLR